MAIKTFTTGEVLTAANTNEFLANSGLVYITSVSMGSAVATRTVSNCFSATYDNYLVQWQGGSMSVDTSISMTLTGAAANEYYTAFMYGSYAGSTVTNEGTTGSASFVNAGGGYSGSATLDVTVYSPFDVARTTNVQCRVRYTSKWGTMSGLHIGFQSCTGFTIVPASGTMTGGNIVVYGYRKA
jgi:hypothetical protein